jgi:hypothetical protein
MKVDLVVPNNCNTPLDVVVPSHLEKVVEQFDLQELGQI